MTNGKQRILRIGVIGCGQAAWKGALPGFSPPGSERAAEAAPFLRFGGAPDVTIALVADIEAQRAEAAAAHFGAECATVGDAMRFLADFGLDGVAICTPPSALAELATAALTAGVSALVEKPAVKTAAQLATLLEARRERPDLACMVNIGWAYHPAVDVARELVIDGAIGGIERVACVFEHGGAETWAPDAAWYNAAGSGGAISDLGLHVLVVLERVLGAPVVLDAAPGRAVAHGRVGTAEATLKVGWQAPAPRFSAEVEGSAASLALQLTPWAAVDHALQIKRPGKEARPVVVGSTATRDGPYRDFACALRSGRLPLTELTQLERALGHHLAWTGLK